MLKLRAKLNQLPEQPGERRISVHWFFPPVALLYLAGGIACLREYPHAKAPQTLMYAGWACVLLGLFMLLTFVLCVRQLRAGRKIESLFTIRVRPLILAACIAAFMAVCIYISLRFKYGMIASMFLWVFGASFIWNRIVRYFQNHPPKR